MALDLSDEYMVEFVEQPFGMAWASRKSDRDNLYVKSVEPESHAFHSNVSVGSKLLKLADQNVEGLGAKEIFWHFTNTYRHTLPLKITFRRPSAEEDDEKKNAPAIGRTLSALDEYNANSSTIQFPVDCSEKTMQLSTPPRLQDIFIIVLEYMATSKNTPEEWVQFLSSNDYQILSIFAKTTKRLFELETDDMADAKSETDNNNAEADDESKSSALGWLCTILHMFGNLSTPDFVDVVTKYAFECVIQSLSHHRRLSRLDMMNRLNLLQWIVLNNRKLSSFVASDAFIANLCDILNSTAFNDVTESTSTVLLYGVARKHKSDIKASLVALQDLLQGDTFRHFTEFYFDLLNAKATQTNDANEAEMDSTSLAAFQLLIEFNAYVFAYDLSTFYFTSDIKVLVDIYLRICTHCAPSSKYLLLTLDGLYNIIRWRNYARADSLDKYKLDDMLQVLCGELTQVVNDSQQEFQTQLQQQQNAANGNGANEVRDTLKLIQLIRTKMNVIVQTLQQIENDAYDYEKRVRIELPIDLSEYSVNTKNMQQLQTDLLEFLYFLSESAHTADEWVVFLTENDSEMYRRLCGLCVRLLQNEKKYVQAAAAGNIPPEYDIDRTQMWPLSALCQLLVMFAMLEPPKFAKELNMRVMNPVRASLKSAATLNVQDVMVRLQVLLFMLQQVDTEFGMEWFHILCVLISEKRDDDQEDNLLLVCTQCVAYFVARLKEASKQKECLLQLQNSLKHGDDFRHFIECYMQLINDIKITQWNELSTKLLLGFAIAVMRQQLTDFFFVSDVRILIEIYQRVLKNIDVDEDEQGVLLCLDGIVALFEWKTYALNEKHTDLNRYKYDDIIAVLQEMLQTAQENGSDNVANLIVQITKIKM